MCPNPKQANGQLLPPEVPEGEDEEVDALPEAEDEDEEPQEPSLEDYDSEEEELDILGDNPYVWGLNPQEDVEVASSANLIRYAEASRQPDFDPVAESERDAEEARIMCEQLMPRMRQIELDMNRARAERAMSGGSPGGGESEEQRRTRIHLKQGLRAIEAYVAAFKAAKRAKYEQDPFDEDGTPPSGGSGGAGNGNGAVPSA